MNNLNKTILIAVFSVLVGCVQIPPDTQERLGQLTVASSLIVDGLEYDKSSNVASYTSGKSCYQVDTASLAYISGPKDNLIQKAIHNAIRNG